MTAQLQAARAQHGSDRAESGDKAADAGRARDADDRSACSRGKKPRPRRFEAVLPDRGERLDPRMGRAARRDDDATSGAVSPGPLGHQRHASPPPTAPGATDAVGGVSSVAGVADRILAGVNGKGEATAMIELGAGDWAGTQVNLVAGARGLEVTVYAATDAARRVVQAKLSSLARALAERGVAAKKIEVCTRHRDNRGGSRQDGRR